MHGLKQCNTLQESLESNFILKSTTNDLTQWNLEVKMLSQKLVSETCLKIFQDL